MVRTTTGEAAAIVRNVESYDGTEAWGLLNTACNKRTLGRIFRLQKECCYPKRVDDVSKVKLAILSWEARWNGMMEELGEGVTVPELWKMSAVLQLCPKDVNDTLELRLDELDTYDKLKHCIISYTTNKSERTRGEGGGGRAQGVVPMDVDKVEYLEDGEEDWNWEDIDAIQTRYCYQCGGSRTVCSSVSVGEG